MKLTEQLWERALDVLEMSRDVLAEPNTDLDLEFRERYDPQAYLSLDELRALARACELLLTYTSPDSALYDSVFDAVLYMRGIVLGALERQGLFSP